MTPVIFINCKDEPFVDEIMSGLKEYETRTRNMLGRFLGERVLIAETGSGRPFVRCSAVIDEIVSVHTLKAWTAPNALRKSYRVLSMIPVGSKYDWQRDTKVKWLYRLKDVQPVAPFRAPEGRRHGRVWMEYEEV